MEAALALARGLLLWAEALVFGTLVVRALGGVAVARALWAALAGLGVFWIGLQSAVIADAGGPVAALSAVSDVLRLTWVGHVALLRVALWGVAWALRRRGAAVWPAGLAMALHGGSGHAAATGDWVLEAAVLVHVLAAGAWVGGLPALWVGLRGAAPERLVARFARLGLVCVVLLAGTAFVQADAFAGGLPGLFGTAYGHVLLVKLGLFAGLIGLALRNQFGRQGGLRWAVAVEAALGLATLLAASLLSALPPGAHEQPDWPFAYRLSFDVLTEDELRDELVWAGIGLVLAVGLGLASLWAGRVRWAVRLAALGLVWLAAPSLGLLLVPAEATVFWESPVAATPATIALGRQVFAQNCVACHGAGGRGDGPLAAGSAVPPADLTAPHLWEHPDGELYAWISDGMEAPDGSLSMPGFRDRLAPALRWALIDFLHANNTAGARPAGVAPHRH